MSEDRAPAPSPDPAPALSGLHAQPIGRPTRATATDAPSGGRAYTGRRFASTYADFSAAGTILRAPAFTENPRGGATATFSIKIGSDRDLDILMSARTLAELQSRLQAAVPGAQVHCAGRINPPRIHIRESAQYDAERFSVFPTEATTPPARDPPSWTARLAPELFAPSAPAPQA